MVQQMIGFFISGFYFPGITWGGLALGIGLSLAFGALWLAAYWPPLGRIPWWWAVALASAILCWTAIALVQIPLQGVAGAAITRLWDQQAIQRWILLAALPQILLSGLVQEAAKLLPVLYTWRRGARHLEPREGLLLGAIAGAGFAILEAAWVHNTVFAQGWNWSLVQQHGLLALSPFFERFFTVPLHIGLSALTGYGLAKGSGWLFYVLAALVHAAANYGAVLYQLQWLGVAQVEAYGALVSLLLTAALLWLRWRRLRPPLPAGSPSP
jgi:RsiW-degrading membrane proteinase PrsW (M82 family)